MKLIVNLDFGPGPWKNQDFENLGSEKPRPKKT